MSLDFSQVKAITIPQGSVKSISINGTTVWEAQVGPTVVSLTASGYTQDFDTGSTWTFGGTVIATYSDSSTADVTSNCTFSGNDTSTAGTKTVTISYSGVSTTYDIYVRTWTTKFSGTKTMTYNVANTPPSNMTVLSGSIATGTYRVTFELSDGIGLLSNRYYLNGTNRAIKPTSPNYFNVVNGTAKNFLLRVSANTVLSSSGKYVALNYLGTTAGILLQAHKPSSGGASSGTISITVTKIEKLDAGPDPLS